MLRISSSLLIALFSIQSIASTSIEYPLQTWSCGDRSNTLNPDFINVRSVKLTEAPNQREIELKICETSRTCKTLTYKLGNWEQTPRKLTGWSQDKTFMYHFTLEFDYSGKARKFELYTTYIHYDGDDGCEGDIK